MKNLTYKIIFLFGLLCEVVGQILLAQGNDFVYQQRPIDFAHGFLLLGVVCLIPQVVSFPQKTWSYVGIPLALTGIVCIIGMCVLDFIWWSFPDQAARIEFSNHISKVPSIWLPFIKIGPSPWFLNFGLFLLSLHYVNQEKLGVGIICIATLIVVNIIPIPFKLIFGYSVSLIGYSLIFLKKGYEKELHEGVETQ